jgi:hypothetical protein
VGARRAQWGRPRARRVPPVARSARRSAERAAAPRGRAYVCVRPAAAVPPLRRSHHPPGAVAQPVVRACSGGCWTFCNEFCSRARVCHPPMQLVCDGVLPRRGLAAALEELAGAPTLRYVHMALCSLADDSVRALCQLEALHTLRCGPHPYHVYESWRPIARHCGMLTGLGVSCRSRACAGSAVLQCAIPCVCACTAQAARLRRRHGRWTRRATSSARAALPVHRVLPTGATGGHAGEREPFTLTLAPNLLPRWAARA